VLNTARLPYQRPTYRSVVLSTDKSSRPSARKTRTPPATPIASCSTLHGWPRATARQRPVNRAFAQVPTRLSPPQRKSPRSTRAGLEFRGSNSTKRVSVVPCASGDELVSLGFRVGNPSAIGWYQPANFPASLLPVGVIPTTSRQLRRTVCVGKWPEAERSRDPAVTQEGRNHPPRRGIFLSSERLPGVTARERAIPLVLSRPAENKVTHPISRASLDVHRSGREHCFAHVGLAEKDGFKRAFVPALDRWEVQMVPSKCLGRTRQRSGRRRTTPFVRC
jgi:hypothetical protein